MSLLIILSLLFNSTPENPEQMVKKMYDRYNGKWYKNLTFTQKNEFYKADTLAGTSIWYEAIEFPDKFRIDVGDLIDGNAAILANDSIYRFKDGEMVSQSFRKNDLTFLGGGMFFMTWDEVVVELKELNYDLSKGHFRHFNKRKVYVIGANNNTDKVNQLWIDVENLYVVKVITFDENKTEAVYENHQKIGGEAWTETKVTFYINDKLMQVEYYSDCKANVELPEGLFNPSQYGKVHWMK